MGISDQRNLHRPLTTSGLAQMMILPGSSTILLGIG
jgi:hypothetical protein